MKPIKFTAAAIVVIFTSSALFAQTSVSPSGLTYGNATKSIKKGETSKTEVLQIFGSPNITTVSKAGDEVWTYDRLSYAETTEGGADAKTILLGGATGAGLGAIIGHQSKSTGKGALLGGILGAAAGWLAGWKTPVHTQGSRTATLMLWFDKNDIVKDYSITSTQF